MNLGEGEGNKNIQTIQHVFRRLVIVLTLSQTQRTEASEIIFFVELPSFEND